jgi:hypothetical protein
VQKRDELNAKWALADKLLARGRALLGWWFTRVVCNIDYRKNSLCLIIFLNRNRGSG